MDRIDLGYIYDKMNKGERLPRTALYDYPMAKIAEEAGIEIINVGDTIAKYVFGYAHTNKVGMDIMVEHAKAVRRGAPNCFVMADMPFLSYRSESLALENAGRFIVEADVDAVKVEGGLEIIPIVKALTEAGIPTIGHTGLSLQSRAIGLGKSDEEKAEDFLRTCRELETAGAIALVYTEIVLETARLSFEKASIPILAAGCGTYTHSPMINMYELLGIATKLRSFAKTYDNQYQRSVNACMAFVEEVRSGDYPDEESVL